jgi:hypothetical protein
LYRRLSENQEGLAESAGSLDKKIGKHPMAFPCVLDAK